MVPIAFELREDLWIISFEFIKCVYNSSKLNIDLYVVIVIQYLWSFG